MNIIFKVPKRRHFLLSLFWSVFMITLLIIFLLLSFTLSSMAVFFMGNEISLFGVKFGSRAGIFMGYIAPFLLVLSTFTAVYLVIPKVRISLGVALSGSFLVTILWELAKHFFTWYVKNVIQFGTIYGSLTTFILFLLWVYYLSCIFLLGGEFVRNMNRRT
jgi:membrane protein